MKKLVSQSLLFLAVTSCAPSEPPAMSAAQESDFQKVIAGYTPGPSQSCVSLRQLRGNKTYGEGVIVFEGPSKSALYVNRPPAGCPELGAFRALRTRTSTTQLCRGDLATVFDTTSRVDYGSCSLGDFVPYRR